MSITDRLEALAAAPKPWQGVIFLPNGDVRTLRQPREDMAQSWVDRMSDKYGIDGYVEYLPE